MIKNKVLYIIVSLFMLLFIYTGISKLLDYHQFNAQVEQSPILKPLANWPVWWIPLGEILLAWGLAFPRSRLLALYACLFSMVVFTIYLFILTQFNDYIPCSCGGILEQIPPYLHILLNVCLSILAFFGIYLEKRHRKSFKAIHLKNIHH
jgi:uncharacterized membrane protein YphA (DoxX/SURF4 family)